MQWVSDDSWENFPPDRNGGKRGCLEQKRRKEEKDRVLRQLQYLDYYSTMVTFLDTQVSLAPTHVRYNLAVPNITLLIRI